MKIDRFGSAPSSAASSFSFSRRSRSAASDDLQDTPKSRRARRRLGTWLALACVLGPVATGHADDSVTLARAIELALESNPAFRSTRQEREIAQGDLQRASYWNRFNPKIGGAAGQRRFNQGGTGTQLAATLSLEVEVAGQRGKRIQEAEKNLDRVGAEIRDAERLLIADVKEAFFRSLYLERRLELLRQVERLNRHLRDASARRYQSGEVAKLEANLAEIRYSQSRKDTLGGERDHRNSLRAVERLLGRNPTGTLRLMGNLAARPSDVDVDAAVRAALDERPDLQARSAEIDRLEAETALTRRLVVPNVTFGGFYNEETEIPGVTDRIVGGQLSVPIPIFDHKQAELTALAGQRAQARWDRSAVELSVRGEVRDAARSYEAASEAVRVFESDALARIAENFGFIETSYREGKIDLLQLVVVQNDMVATQRSYLDSLWDYWQARIALERAIGRPLDDGVRP